MTAAGSRLVVRSFALALATLAVGGYAATSFILPATAASEAERIAAGLRVPPGARMTVFAAAPDARALAASADGRVVFIGTARGDHVMAAMDADLDGKAERVVRFTPALTSPNGVALRDGDLYVGTLDAVLVYPDAVARALAGDRAPTPATVLSGFKPDWHHGRRVIRFGPDGLLHVALGAPCNICALTPNTGKIVAADVTGPPLGPGEWRVVADGIRNSVGMDWDAAGRLWFTDNGADHMGDEIPADELNRMPDSAGGPPPHFGFPWRGGRDVALTGADRRPAPPEDMIPAAAELTAHGAALGIVFLTSPPEYAGDAVIAQHGSWNRTTTVGHRLVRAEIENGEVASVTPFVEGWLRMPQDEVLGRPVDVIQMPDGALLISDDHADTVWRLSWD